MQSRRWLLSSWGSAGDVFPFLALARGLVARGHSVTLVLDPMWKERAILTGARFVPLLKQSQQDLLRTLPQVITSAVVGAKALTLLIRHGIVPIYHESFQRLYKEARGHDAIIAHHFGFPAADVALALDIPLFTVTLSPGIVPGKNQAPASLPFHWPSSSAFSPLSWMIWKVGRYMMRAIVDSALNPIRITHGLPKGKDLFFSGFRKDFLLQLYSSHFAKAAEDWPEDWRPLGFSFYDEAVDAALHDPALRAFLNAGDAPWLFTLGTTIIEHPGDFFTDSLKGIGERRAIFLAGRHAPRLKNLFSKFTNLYVTDYIPLQLILPRCSGAIHQCGIGTLAQILRAGIPSVAVPFAFDQPQNAIRLERLRLAIKIPASKFSPSRLAKALTTIEKDPTYAANATLLAKKIGAEDGVKNAISRLESSPL